MGKWLHLVTILAFIIFSGGGRSALCKFDQGDITGFLISSGLGLYGLVLIFFAQMDAFSRFQNYKLAKDLFFKNKFKKRIADLFSVSRCQRDAVLVAAKDLELASELAKYYDHLGYRWYHLLPDRVLENPGILLTRAYWKKTLFVCPYQSKYFLW